MFKSVDSFRPHFDALARVGYFEIGLEVFKPVSHKKRLLHNYYRIFMWSIILMYNLQHVIRAVQVRHSTEKMVDTLFILLTTLNTLGKQTAFIVHAGRIKRIVGIVDGDLHAARNSFHESVLKTNALAMSRLLTLYHGAIFLCTVLWTVFPIVNRATGNKVEFSAYFPFDTKQSPAFELAVTYMSVLIMAQAYGNVTMDCTIVAFYAQAKTQLQMIRFDLEHFNDDNDKRDERGLIAKSRYIYRDWDQSSAKILNAKLLRCVKHYELIAWFVKEVESIFGEAMFVQFIVMAWVICMTVYKIIGLSILSAEFISMAVYLGCMLAQLFIYCYYGTQLKVESESVNQSVYSSDWLSLSPRYRCNLLIFMERCHRSIAPRVAYIVPMSLETYIALSILSAEFISMAVYLGCMLAQLFIYCYYGTQLKVESESVNQSVYSSDWLSLSPRYRCNLLIFMERCHRSIAPRVAYIVPMSLETYIAVIRSSYTLFTFLERK